MRIEPSGAVLGATITGIDLSSSLSDSETATILGALGEHGVLCFPGQSLEPAAQKMFCQRFGSLEVNVASGSFQAPDNPEVMILSNIVEDGRRIGLGDAGQGWHTDMSYSKVIALATVLHAVEVPRSNGRTLGSTRFASMHAAYDALPDDIRVRLDGKTAVHDFEKFWEMMRAEKGNRPPLSDEQRRQKPPVSHPLFLTHPVTGRKVLYANPGYVTRIEGVAESESDELLAFLFAHQLEDRFLWAHEWTEGDVLMWDDIGTLHNAVADYGPEQRRLMRRCQVVADRVFDPAGAHAAG